METNAIFRKNYGSFRRFFSMLGKADLPYLWIIGYLAASAVIANVGVSTTEYSAALFAGNVGMTAVVLPYLFYQILSLVLGSVSGLTEAVSSALRRLMRSCTPNCRRPRIKLMRIFTGSAATRDHISAPS